LASNFLSSIQSHEFESSLEIAGVLISLSGTNHSFLSQRAVYKIRLVEQIFFSAFFAADALVAVGMFEVTMVTGSASVGVTTAYWLGPWETVR
jgi:hypothetical protein